MQREIAFALDSTDPGISNREARGGGGLSRISAGNVVLKIVKIGN